jgi:hypothetical protein
MAQAKMLFKHFSCNACAAAVVALLLYCCCCFQVKQLYDPKRTRLSMDKAKDMLYVASTWRLQHKQELLAAEKTETAFWVTPIEEENEQQDVVVLE